MGQERLRRCPRCGELAGEALVDDQWEGLIYLPVVCICDGIVCRYCGENMVRRPISNYFVEATGGVWHTPWFGALIPCRECLHRRETPLMGHPGPRVVRNRRRPPGERRS